MTHNNSFMKKEKITRLTLQMLNESINKRNLGILDDIIAPEFISKGHLNFKNGPEGFKDLLHQLFHEFPDISISIEKIMMKENLLVVIGHWTLIHYDEFMAGDIPHNIFCIPYFDFWQFKDGKCIENSARFDVLSMIQKVERKKEETVQAEFAIAS